MSDKVETTEYLKREIEVLRRRNLELERCLAGSHSGSASRDDKEKPFRAMLGYAVEQAAETVMIISAEGLVQYINPAAEKLMGYSRDEVLGHNPFAGERGEYPRKFYREIWEAICNGVVWNGRITSCKKDGSRCELETTISPIRDHAGSIISYVSIGRDVSEEVRLQKHLQQVQKLEAMGQLAGGIAHDFNNILGAIIGFTEMAYYEASDDGTVKYDLERILEAGVRAKKLVKQIMAFSNNTPQKKAPVQICFIIQEALELLRSTLPASVEIRQDLDAATDLIMADSMQIHQMLTNLCNNAAQAMHGGGVLEVVLSSTVLDAAVVERYPRLEPGPYMRLTVTDTGAGIPPNIQERIFEPFFTTRPPGEGSGLGLAVTHGIVEGHGGAISVHSKAGEGTTFHVLLPVFQEEVAGDGHSLKPLPTGSEKILFVDDEQLLVIVGQKMLESLGYKVVATTSSPEALAVFQTDPDTFDLVITDQTMPAMSGIELAENITALRPGQPVIICSGFSEELTDAELSRAGIKKFIMKPITREQIAEVIRNVLDKNNEV
ncbi:MAG: response regulator [Deltaproteobacteria bacterium]|nr:response regulator [Deltaproteobacteria bacterium]